jgi:thiamine pyrophosphokinase
MEGPHCGLIPMAGKSRMRTKGLKWDMQEDWVSEFGGLVSTSNLVDYQDDGDKDYILTVEIMEGVVVWTTEFSVKYFSTNPSNLLSN